MRLVVDSNVLFTFFWKDSAFRNILNKSIELFAPEYALEEINEHSSEIIKKTSCSESEFKKLKTDLALKVVFVPLEEYSSDFPRVISMADQLINEEYTEFVKDIDFFALAVKISCPIWSNDKLFKKQSKLLVFTTKEIIELFDTLK